MLPSKNSEKKSGLDEAIEDVLEAMKTHANPQSEIYAKMVDQLVKIHGLKQNEKTGRVSKDVMVTVGANLVGIMLIVGHERVNVVTSKALMFVKKLL